ncbi:hypothetical protein M8C21_001812, partial [Ambrosia artemisiifolia]
KATFLCLILISIATRELHFCLCLSLSLDLSFPLTPPHTDGIVIGNGNGLRLRRSDHNYSVFVALASRPSNKNQSLDNKVDEVSGGRIATAAATPFGQVDEVRLPHNRRAHHHTPARKETRDSDVVVTKRTVTCDTDRLAVQDRRACYITNKVNG